MPPKGLARRVEAIARLNSVRVFLTWSTGAAPQPWLPAGKPELADDNVFINSTFC